MTSKPLTLHFKAKPQVETAARECGTCSMCCRLLGIKAPDLNKLPGVWCPHVKLGHGCGIYATRPGVCRSFECVWLASTVAPPEMRPDKIKGMLTTTTDGKHLVLHEDPGYPGHAHAALRKFLDKWIAKGDAYYVVACGPSRRFYGNPALLPVAKQMLAETLAPE